MFEDYEYFRSTIPLKTIYVDVRDKSWKIFDAGPKTIQSPLILLPPVCGTADIYFKQLLELSRKGYRVISAQYPPYWTIEDWCRSFMRLLDYLGLSKVHLFGASLGGFLAQKFVEHTKNCPRVLSLFLCNTFVDTEIFDHTESCSLFWLFPTFLLRRMLHPSLITNSRDPRITGAVYFVASKANQLSQPDLASRLTLNCATARVKSNDVAGLHVVTIMDVFDDYALTSPIKEEIYHMYPQAKLAQLKSGGNFPYLSRHEEVNIHLQIHLRKFEDTLCSAKLIENNRI